MAETYDLILKGGTVVNQDGEGVRDIGIRGGRIAAIGDLSRASAGEVIDCRGLHVLPGVIDSQVHFREPGLTHKEDLETGSRGAVLGGVTAVFEMPNTDPTTTSAEALADKVERGASPHALRLRLLCRRHAREHQGACRAGAAAGRLPASRCSWAPRPARCWSRTTTACATSCKAIRRRAAFHSEDEYRLRERMNLRVEGDPRSHPVWRDAIAALMCTQRLIALARETGKRVHVLHVTTKEEIAFLAEHKDVASAEATPAHLTLAAPDCYERLGTLAQLNPPVRDAAHRDGIWHGLAQGVVDSSAPTTRRTRARRRRSPIRRPIPA